MNNKTYNIVKRPKHYNVHPSGIECIEVVRHFSFNLGNAIKYMWRQGEKEYVDGNALESAIVDLEKSQYYIADEIKRLRKIQHKQQRRTKKRLAERLCKV